ncbi:TRAP-type C4-dicarboxylate transport system permease large subunit [Nocardia transvalensis]|uniref:TRAP-type C4-dicarboxylate transport system permease large subunit n=1 Tax=Nocardia transvalensis TaxID=37333 RepID=A0A7W9UL92_9NOCA|nr:hypothetical protein [Nocardia transvalensis]MBB5917313.1 TRAP-type C4-dicarboxylate transport system permease large subunit [Nocardia transvalensis]
MIVLLGLIVLIAAIVVGAAAVSANLGDAHLMSTGFTVFGHDFTGSLGELFAAGAVVGAAGMLGLALLLTGAFNSARRNAAVRRELRRSRREMVTAKKESAKPAPAAATPPAGEPAQQPMWSRNRFLRRRPETGTS